MLTVEDIKRKVAEFPENKPAKELINEILLLYKIENGLKEVAGEKRCSLKL